ncbi:SIR2-like domain-containing protein, partial [Teratosphaeria destructans]
MQRSNIIASSIENGTVQDDDSRGCGWPSVKHRVERMLEQVDYRTTIFIGAAASSFKPTAFPAWNKFVELIYSSSIDQAASDLFPGDKIETQPQDVTTNLKQCIAEALTQTPPAARVPNYKFTETIARRLGKDYLRLLQAFRCQRAPTGHRLVNHVHDWAARALIDHTAAA